jgi:signal transduction histidine kinase
VNQPSVGSSLFGKYLVVLVLLVSAAVLITGLVGMYFLYENSQRGVMEVQREKALGATVRIEEFIRAIEQQMRWVVPPPIGADTDVERRTADYRRLLRQALPITEARYVDAAGHEQLLVSRLRSDTTYSGIDFSAEPVFRETRGGQTFFGPLYFLRGSEPYMRIGIPEGAGAGVTVAEVNLTFIWDVVSQIHVGEAGYAYVVDSAGRLVAHPDITEVLSSRDLSSSPQVRAAIAYRPSAPSPGAQTVVADDRLASYAAVNPPGWAVLVEQPLDEAFAPVQTAIARIGTLILFGLLLAVGTSILLARRMATPIKALQKGAERIGAGELDYRIEVQSSDEIEALARDFNRMAAQLSETYASLEQKVDDRTRELAATAAELREKSEELQAASRHKSEFLANMSHELRTPLNAIIGFSQVLLEGMAGEITPEQRACTDDILSAGRHLLSLINDVLDLSKVESGHMELEPYSFSVPSAIDEGVSMIRPRAASAGITVATAIEADVGNIEADERRFKQVLFNLLSNAVKFTPRGGRIEISARRVGHDLEVAVSDN